MARTGDTHGDHPQVAKTTDTIIHGYPVKKIMYSAIVLLPSYFTSWNPTKHDVPELRCRSLSTDTPITDFFFKPTIPARHEKTHSRVVSIIFRRWWYPFPKISFPGGHQRVSDGDLGDVLSFHGLRFSRQMMWYPHFWNCHKSGDVLE